MKIRRILLILLILILAVPAGAQRYPILSRNATTRGVWHTFLNDNLIIPVGNDVDGLVAGFINLTTENVPLQVAGTLSYSNGTTFTITGDHTADFPTSRIVILDLGTDGVKCNTVASSSYATPTTTVILNSSCLTANLAHVWANTARPGLFTSSLGWIYARDYGSPSQTAIATAMSVAGPSGVVVLCTGIWNIGSDLTITTALRAEPGAVLTRTAGDHLTINGAFKCGLTQCFDDNSANHDWVIFRPGAIAQIYPQWWGATGDGSTDDTAAIQAAVVSVNNGGKFRQINIPPGDYSISTINFYPYVGIRGSGDSTRFIVTGVGPGFRPATALITEGVDNYADLLSDCKIDASANGNNFYMVIIDQYCMQRAIRHVNFAGNINTLQGAVHLDMGSGGPTGNMLYHNLIEDCQITNCRSLTGAIYLQGYFSLTRPINSNQINRCRFEEFLYGIYIEYGTGNRIMNCSFRSPYDPVKLNGSSGGHEIPIVTLRGVNNLWEGGYCDNGSANISILSSTSSTNSTIGLSWISGYNITATNQVIDLQSTRFFTTVDGLTYVNTTTATVTGDKTADITVGRKCWFNGTAGWKSSTVVSRTYNGGTNLTTIVINDARFDSGLYQYSQEHSFNRTGIPSGINGSIFPSLITTNLAVGATGTTLTNIRTSTFTCANNKDTVVADTSIMASGSFIDLMPTNASAITLSKSAARLVVTARVTGTSFTVSTADNTAAVGTETFRYMVIN